MRVLVTGAAGQLGWHTTAHLHKAGFDVVATDVLYRADCPVRLQMADLLDRHAAYKLLEGCDALVHLGNHANQHAIEPWQRLYTENVTMNMNVIQAALDMGIRRIVFASSIQAACSRRYMLFPLEEDPPKSPVACLPFDTATPTQPGNHYALSKEASEKMLDLWAFQHPGRSFTSIRYPTLIHTNLPRYHRHYGAEGWPLFLDEAFSYLTFDDAADLIETLLHTSRPGHTVVMPSANDNRLNLTAAELIKLLYRGVPLKKTFSPDARTVFDLGELKALYNWSPKLTVPHHQLPPELHKLIQAKINAPE